jgi:hypothetical protein
LSGSSQKMIYLGVPFLPLLRSIRIRNTGKLRVAMYWKQVVVATMGCMSLKGVDDGISVV